MHLRAELHIIIAIYAQYLLDHIAGAGDIHSICGHMQTQHIRILCLADSKLECLEDAEYHLARNLLAYEAAAVVE